MKLLQSIESGLVVKLAASASWTVAAVASGEVQLYTWAGDELVRLASRSTGLTRLFDLAVSETEIAVLGPDGLRRLSLPALEPRGEKRGSFQAVGYAHGLWVAGRGKVEPAEGAGSAEAGERNTGFVRRPGTEEVALSCSWQNGSRLRFYAPGPTLLDRPVVRRNSDTLRPCGFSLDGGKVALADDTLNLYDLEKGWLAGWDERGHALDEEDPGGNVDALWSNALIVGEQVCAGSPPGLILRAVPGRAAETWQAHQAPVLSLLAHGERLVSAGSDGKLCVWGQEPGQ